MLLFFFHSTFRMARQLIMHWEILFFPLDKQLIQYTAFPLLAFLDGNPGSTVESGSSATETPSSVDKPLEVDELLESSLDPEPTQSKLVRLEPLTEAEASEATLFYLCELAPAPMDTDMPFLDN